MFKKSRTKFCPGSLPVKNRESFCHFFFHSVNTRSTSAMATESRYSLHRRFHSPLFHIIRIPETIMQELFIPLPHEEPANCAPSAWLISPRRGPPGFQEGIPHGGSALARFKQTGLFQLRRHPADTPGIGAYVSASASLETVPLYDAGKPWHRQPLRSRCSFRRSAFRLIRPVRNSAKIINLRVSQADQLIRRLFAAYSRAAVD